MKVLGIDGGNIPSFRKRRQVARREEVDAGDAQCRAQFGRTPRAVRQLFQDAVRHLVTALLQNAWDSLGHVLLEAGDIPPPCLLQLLIIDRKPLQAERAIGNEARPSAFRSAAPRPSKLFAGVGGYDQMAALIGLKVAQRSHAAHYSIFRNYSTTQTTPLGSAPRAPFQIAPS